MVNIFLKIIWEKIFSWYFLAKINWTKHSDAFFTIKIFIMPKTTKEGDPDWEFYLNNGADMFWPFVSKKSLERGCQVTFWTMTKRIHPNVIFKRLNIFLPKGTKAWRSGLDFSYSIRATNGQHISENYLGKKIFLVLVGKN